jgi:hypothetical protein
MGLIKRRGESVHRRRLAFSAERDVKRKRSLDGGFGVVYRRTNAESSLS